MKLMMYLIMVMLIAFVVYFGLGVIVGRFVTKYAKTVCSMLMVVVWMFNTTTNTQMNIVDAYKVMWSVQPTMVVGNILVAFVMIGICNLGCLLGKKLRTRKDRA